MTILDELQALPESIGARVRAPHSKKVHHLTERKKWNLKLTLCGSSYEPDHGWQVTSDPLDCGACLRRIEDRGKRVAS